MINTTTLNNDFIEFVASDVRGQLSDKEAEILRLPETLDAWHEALVVLLGRVDSQFAHKKAELMTKEARAAAEPDNTELQGELTTMRVDHMRWRAGTVRFKTSIQARLAEVRLLKSQTPRLVSAIIAHRDHVCTEACDASCEADKYLWSLISSQTVA